MRMFTGRGAIGREKLKMNGNISNSFIIHSPSNNITLIAISLHGFKLIIEMIVGIAAARASKHLVTTQLEIATSSQHITIDYFLQDKRKKIMIQIIVLST